MTKTTAERGYGAKHQAERKRWAAVLSRQAVECSRCGQEIGPNPDPTSWELDHNEDRTAYTGPAHKVCNRRAGGIKAQSIKRTVVREW